MAFLEGKNQITSQLGFRPKLSTELAATPLLDNIWQRVDEGNLVGATFIDLNKAFDTSHDCMFSHDIMKRELKMPDVNATHTNIDPC